jgi:hypothetical protein
MAATDFAGSIFAVRLRIARLLASGALASGANASYVTDALTKLDLKPVYADPQRIEERNGSGIVCVSGTGPKTLLRYDVSITVCTPDEQLEEILAGGVLLTSGGQTVGYGVPPANTDLTPGGGVSIEAWSRAVIGGKPAATNPFRHWALPQVINLARADSSLEAAAHTPTFDGEAYENAAWGTGPNAEWTLASTRILQRRRVAVLPAVSADYVALP